MTRHAFAVLMVVLGLVGGGCASDRKTGEGEGTPQGADKGANPSQPISRVDPCSLVTKEEIQQQLELAGSPSQAAALKSKGAVWTVAMEPAPRGESRACQVHWQASVDGDVRRQDDFTIVVTFAGWLTGSVAGMKQPLPIPNLGDEAYFVGGSSGPPYARVGDIAVGIENFPDTKQSKSGVYLLRLAVPRARAAQ
ncbi:MAG TPA: hypothetical protein VLN49_25590 [Gemmatimonadaceae bacterium]|nr:hypothetical protein [Gemmatimonadaceae bacterium]